MGNHFASRRTDPATAHNNRFRKTKGHGISPCPLVLQFGLVVFDLGTSRVRSMGRRYHGDRALQREVQHGLRCQLNLLTLGRCLYAASQSATSRCADSSPLTAARDRTDDRADARAGANFLRRILAAGGSAALVLVSLDAVGLAPY